MTPKEIQRAVWTVVLEMGLAKYTGRQDRIPNFERIAMGGTIK